MSGVNGLSMETQNLRERVNHRRSSSSSTLPTPTEEDVEKEQKTFGRTPDETSKSTLQFHITLLI